MLRPAQLNSRFSVQKGGCTTDIDNKVTRKGDGLQGLYHRMPPQASTFEDQLAWVDDRGTSSSEMPLRRAISDPIALLEESSTFDFTINDGGPLPTGAHIDPVTSRHKDHSSDYSGCVYGPNSPRRMENLTQSEISVLSAIFECVNCNPFQYVCLNSPSCSGFNEADAKGGNFAARATSDQEQPLRINNGQRSRVRKLQYITELENTINALQTAETGLAAKVASLFQQRAVLSLENSTLRQKITSLRKEKMIKDGQYQTLKKEVKKLKANLAGRGKSKECVEVSAGY